MFYAKRCFHLKWISLLFCITLSAVTQQMHLTMHPSETAEKTLNVKIETSSVSSIKVARCTLYVDTAVLHSSKAIIMSCVKNLVVSGSFGGATDMIVLTSSLFDSSQDFSQGTMVLIKLPVLSESMEYSSAIHIIGGSIELSTGDIVQVNIIPTKVQHENNQHLKQYYNVNIITMIPTGKVFDLRGRNVGYSSKMLQFSGKRCRLNLNRRPGLSHQIFILK